MYTEEKVVLANHIAATAKRLLDAKGTDGAFVAATKVLEVGVWLDKVETAPKPEVKSRTPKK